MYDAASVLRANEFPGLMSRSYAVALADVLEILAYVKRYEPYSDYMGTSQPDPSVALASLILGEEP